MRKITTNKLAFLMAALLLVYGCAGLRQGYYSRPYFGTAHPGDTVAATRGEQVLMQTLRYEGITLILNIMNDLQTSDTLWAGIEVPMVPAKADLEKKWRYIEKEGGHCIRLELTSKIPGIEIHFGNDVLIVDGVAVASMRARQMNKMMGKEELINKRLALTVGDEYEFELCYEIKRPTPDSQIQLDLGEFIIFSSKAILPIINFQKQPYRDPYS